MPPTTSLPYTDRLCFDSLYTSLSPKNILKCIAAILQESRILLVSEHTDSLTLCAQALLSLIYPFRWYHPFVPIVPLTITESVSVGDLLINQFIGFIPLYLWCYSISV